MTIRKPKPAPRKLNNEPRPPKTLKPPLQPNVRRRAIVEAMQRLRDEYRQVGRKDGPTFQILAKELKGILQHEPEKLTEEEYQAALAAVVKRAKKRADGAEPLIIPDGKEACPKQD